MQSSGLDVMMDGDKTDDLARMYRLFIRVPQGLLTLQKALKESVVRRGKEVNALATTGPSNEADVEGDGEGEEAAEDSKAKSKKKAPTPKGVASRATEAALQWMQSVLELKDKTDKLLKVCFGDDRSIQTTLSEVRAVLLNIFTRMKRLMVSVARLSRHSSTTTQSRQSIFPCPLTRTSGKA